MNEQKPKTIIEFLKEAGYVMVVRCKNCTHGEPGVCGDGVVCDGVWHENDWFCADGERKEGW